jgi:hypothetical protein
MATMEKMVARQPMTVHLRLMRTRRYSRSADSCGGSQGCSGGPDGPNSNELVGGISRIVEAVHLTKWPESINTPQ